MKAYQVSIEQYTIQVFETGTGCPIVFLHGFLSNSSAWTELITHLSPHYRCISIDLLGFGKSSKPDIPLSIEMQVSIAQKTIESLDLEECILVGHSMGGWIAASYAIQHQCPAIKHLILLAPAGIRDEQLRLRYLFYLPFIWPSALLNVSLALSSPFLEAAGFQEELNLLARVRQYLKERPQTTSKMWEEFLKTQPRIESIDDQLHQLQIPTLIISGAKDSVIPFSHAQTYLQRIPEAQLICFQDAKHNLHITHAKRIAQHLLQLREINPVR